MKKAEANNRRSKPGKPKLTVEQALSELLDALVEHGPEVWYTGKFKSLRDRFKGQG